MKRGFVQKRGREASWTVPNEEESAVFESMRAYQGVIFRCEEHLERLFESAKTAGVSLPTDREKLRRALYEELRRSGRQNAFIRITVEASRFFIIVAEKGYPPEVYEKGVSVVTTPVRKSLSNCFYPEAKSPAYGPAILATLALPEGNCEALFISPEGWVQEGRTSNLFMMKGRSVWTPPTLGIIDGVTRREILQCAKFLGLECHEGFFTRHDLFNADEALLTNTSGEVIPVCEVDGRKIGKRLPGKWTTELHREFRKRVSEAVRREQRRRHA